MASALAPGLARKVKKILEIKTESPELVSALSTLSGFYDQNGAAERRQLRSAVERRGLDINRQFLDAAETVIRSLDDVQAQLDALAASCTSMTEAVASAKTSGGALLAEADKLGREAAAVESKAALVEQFLEQYQLTPEEVAALQGGQVGPAFFGALARVRAIHDNCRQLLRSHHQRAGLELMDQMSHYQEGAYEHLCRWVQSECRNLGEHDAPEVDPTLTAAVAALRQRPVLFKYCAEEVASARHGALFQRFVVALTRGGPGGVPAPIEIHAHDPRRYVADMMAWAHQALAGEREFVMALFGEGGDDGSGGFGASSGGGGGFAGPEGQQQQQQQQQQRGSDPSGGGGGGGGGGGDAPSSVALLDRIFEGVCRPLRVRVEQVIMMSPPLLLCFQLSQLGAFYHDLVSRILGPSAALSTTLAGCRDMARRAFFEQLRAAGDRLLRAPPAPAADLLPPPQVAATLATLSEIVAAHEGALGGSAAGGDGGGGGDEGMSQVLDAVLEPMLEMCRRSSEALRPDSGARLDEAPAQLDPSAQPAFLLNCVSAAQAALAPHACCAPRAAALAGAAEELVRQLVRGEVARLLGRCGLAEVAERVRLYKASGGGSGPLASDPSLSLHTVSEALRSFFVLVSSPDALPEFRSVQQPRLRGEAIARVASSLAEAYDLVYTMLGDPSSGYPEAGGAAGIKHTPAQVRTILGVAG
ncbi:Conserved oligomeric Golgi complex subunit 6 [Monoraphidium neglectum]|uniref:Conserved oligomeric Golgi complex subunit 6 n=1 Tax=Monoraphidium neglectum TaxID=145388 RepID=A0A0D2N8W1_9CHLO|nr:Conserved oligomeric Golgi complex subunit 6 [Monoraphidium neglectum]KIZ02121.1 Conserved oligomeric Golgi complex subunit 6 [Monoraphidium neglectum]|eukprot:XP_013901140.1 Conserved oligomeric Golgi complex subunit 6 [Monoraphidium neglectum]